MANQCVPGLVCGSVLMAKVAGKLVWVREEALSSIVAVEMLELPVSDTDAAIEQEFDHKETGILGMFVHRISSQIIQLRSSLMTLLGDRMSEGQSSGLVRDEFGLHKIIVAATASGKLFGIDNLSGEILWQRRLEDATPFLDQTTDRKHMVLYVQRTTRHFPHPAQCLLLFQDKLVRPLSYETLQYTRDLVVVFVSRVRPLSYETMQYTRDLVAVFVSLVRPLSL
uniref:ER membrane protein complex subunit 1 n=1 Tax=Timema monikensis TaxID=170555 RepID=A0A7R9E736_9NEOP|nr:unnamed protein product [Timema monikensis]